MLTKRLIYKKTISSGVYLIVDNQLHQVQARGKLLFGYLISAAYINAKAEVIAETITCRTILKIYASISSNNYRLTFAKERLEGQSYIH